ncbi:MAG: DUF4384 domain-containing protein [Candidatus Cryptobacteroides sp.]
MKFLLRKISLLTICLLGFTVAHASDIVTVRKAVGRWEVSRDITLAQAEEKAFIEAKKEALRLAGVMENVWSIFSQVTTDNGTEFADACSSVSTIAISGLVNVTDKKVSEFWDPQLKKQFVEVTISARVTKDDTKEDKTYALTVNDIEPVYKSGDVFECSFKVHGADSYIKFFWFDDNGAAMIYPNEYEGNPLFKAGQTYRIPLTDGIELTMEKQDKTKDIEKVNVIIVATKKDYPYLGGFDYQSILTWIYNLPADQRSLYYTLTLIK